GIFGSLRAKFEPEFRGYKLHMLAMSMMLPLFKLKMKEWNPLQQPEFEMDLFIQCKKVITNEYVENGVIFSLPNELNPYSKLVYETVVPKIRSSINSWNTSESEQCLQLYEKWQDLL